jgi:ABC-2 type transport system permease protein
MIHKVYKRIRNIIKKEWEITFHNINSALFITLLPLLITAQVLVVIYLVIKFASGDALMSTILQAGVEKLVKMIPALSDLPSIEKFQVFFYLQFPIYLLLIPTMIANSFATFSIIEEKQTHTLEPLLATPVRTWELLLSKSLAGSIPAIIITWICTGIFLLGVTWIGPLHLLKFVLTSSWFISIFVLVPLITVLSFMLGVIASSRANDPKSAQNMAVVIVIPVLSIVGIQLIGLTVFTPLKLIIMAIVIGVLDIIILRIAVSLFQRESIIVKWR